MSDAYEQQDFAAPAETREFPNGRADLVRIGGTEIGRLTLQPGWRWSTDVRPSPALTGARPRTSSTTWPGRCGCAPATGVSSTPPRAR